MSRNPKENFLYYPQIVQNIPHGYAQGAQFVPIVPQMLIPVSHFNVPINQPKKSIKKVANDLRPWTLEEDQHIMGMFKAHGPIWDIISSAMPDRTPMAVQGRALELQRNFPIPSVHIHQASPCFMKRFPGDDEKPTDEPGAFQTIQTNQQVEDKSLVLRFCPENEYDFDIDNSFLC